MPHINYQQTGLAQHRIGLVEAEDVLYDGWTHRRVRGEGYLVHGRSLEGRLLELEVAQRDGELWVLAGRELDELERARYRRRRFIESPPPAGEQPLGKPPKRPDEPLPPRRIETKVLGLRLDDPSMRWLEQAAERHGVSPSVLARMWVMAGLGEEPPLVES